MAVSEFLAHSCSTESLTLLSPPRKQHKSEDDPLGWQSDGDKLQSRFPAPGLLFFREVSGLIEGP
ncbi:hypothetical protein EYF80_013591 [Liparis tanakae]|uniref:Uncharacterized protein n=1 Tax=Liparis tanakae TaxID=230148 RepID=A0A4Z2IGM6_9TELE|nr:hypothetical protein EYF80_013591 [Liparis tanakae]